MNDKDGMDIMDESGFAVGSTPVLYPQHGSKTSFGKMNLYKLSGESKNIRSRSDQINPATKDFCYLMLASTFKDAIELTEKYIHNSNSDAIILFKNVDLLDTGIIYKM